MNDPRDTLTDLFKKLPGVGPRQARRFVYALLSLPASFRAELTRAIIDLGEGVVQCKTCKRYFRRSSTEESCDICTDPHTDGSTLLLVEKDVDLETVRRSGSYQGRYFVLGGTIPILAEDPTKHIRAKELLSMIKESDKSELSEVIIALSVNAEGENTAQYVKKVLEPIAQEHGVRVTVLGRGLSTGTELEYSDADTLANALLNRR